MAGIIPSSDDQSCVFIGASPRDAKRLFSADPLDAMVRSLAHWSPRHAEAIRVLGLTGRARRFLGAPGHLKTSVGAGWALVGDAGYFKDPCTSHGITDAFLDAERLATALLTAPSDLARYETERNQTALPFFDMTHRIARLDWTIPDLIAMHQSISHLMKSEQIQIETNVPALAA